MVVKRAIILAAASLVMLLIIILLGEKSPATMVERKFVPSSIRGRVVSKYGPVKNARVRVRGEDRFVLTNSLGQFLFPTGDLQQGKVIVTAGKEGWFNNGRVRYTSGRIRDIFLNPVYLNDQSDYRFFSPVVCARCHVKVTRFWDRSKMAHTTSNPKVLNMYYGTDATGRKGSGFGYRLDNPGKGGDCITCHAPSASSRHGSLDLSSVLRSPLVEWDGISCDYCHKVRKVVPDKARPSGMRPVLERQTASRGSSILEFGPYDDVVVPPMAASYNPVFKQAQFCSTCHSHFKKLRQGRPWNHGQVYSDSEWAGFGLKDDTSLPVQTTFQEWKQWQDALPPNDSNKGKKCQDCHMSWRKDMLPYDNYVVDGMARNMWGTYRDPKNIHPHHFIGGTETQLKTALAMELEGKITGKRLDITAYITNTNGGHWVPTGETMRSVMLVVQAFDSRGRALKILRGGRLPDWTGKGDPLKGNYAGLPGAVFSRVLEDGKDNLNVPFWRATRIAADTRIRPKSTVTLKFAFAMDDPEDEPTAKARLIYRPVIRSWAVKKGWSVEDIVIASQAW